MQDLDNLHINFSPSSLWVLNAILGFIMFGVALDLKWIDLVQLTKNWKSALVGLFSQYILLPFTTYLLVLIVQPSPGLALGMFLIAACPVGNVTNLITKVSKGNVALSIGLSSTAHLVAAFVLPLNFALYGNLYSPTASLMRQINVDGKEMAWLVFLIIGTPLLLGILCQRYFPRFTELSKVWFNRLSMLFLAFFIVAAFASNGKVLVDNVQKVAWLVILQNGWALGGGWALGKLFKLPEADIRTITIESGIHNSGLGLLLIFQFFDGRGSMALVAVCWGVWHLISGWALAWYWAQRSPAV